MGRGNRSAAYFEATVDGSSYGAESGQAGPTANSTICRSL